MALIFHGLSQYLTATSRLKKNNHQEIDRVTKGFGSTPIKKWHFTKAPKGSKAFEMAANARQEDPGSRFFPVIVQDNNTSKFELVVFLVKRTKKIFDILLATVDKETILSQKEAEEIAKEFSKGLSVRRSSQR